MQEFFTRVFTQILEFFKSLSPAKRVGLIGTGIVIFSAMVALFIWAGKTSYQPLMTNLNAEDSANIIRFLRDKKIPFEVDPTGKIISVPPDEMHDLRFQLATIGLPQTSVVGYEVFDKQTLATTSFVQKLNQKRAQEGELMRSINTIKGVKRSRVHLAIPQKSTFVEDQKKPSASVVLDLETGIQLNEKQVFGVGNLVAKAVEGLDVSDVVIMDSQGKILSKNSSDPLAAATASQLEYRQKIENDMEKRVEFMLSRIVGEGHVVVRVSSEVDFSETHETQTTYDADGSAIRSVQKDNQSMEGSRPSPGGVAGVATNTANGVAGGVQNQVAGVRTDTKRANEVTNYEIPQTIRKTSKPQGTIKKLSVAVLVDGKTVKTTDADGKALSKVEPWSPEKLKEFEDVVVSALGIDRKRGDTLEIRNMEFTREDFDEAQKVLDAAERKHYIRSLIVYSIIGIAIALFFVFVVRPFIKWVTENTVDSVDTFLPQTIEELERMQKNVALPGIEETVPVLPERMDPEKVEGDMIKEKIITLIDTNPHKAAMVLKDWIIHNNKKDESKAAGGKG